MDRDAIARPEVAALDLLLLGYEVDHVDPLAELVVVPEVVIEAQLRHPAGCEKLLGSPGRGDMEPSLGGGSVFEIIIEPDPKVAIGQRLAAPPHRTCHLGSILIE